MIHLKFSIVILHYNNIEETIDCVSSIQKLIDYNDFEVKLIIVDNHSPDGSGKILKEVYKNTDNIKIIMSDCNLGFSKGNNLGYQYAMKYYNPDFIILSNNDVAIEDKKFFHKIIEEYSNSKFDILGPDIYNPITQIHQSPLFVNQEIDLNYVNKRRKILILKKYLNYISLFLPSLIDKIDYKRQLRKQKDGFFEKYCENVCIHGSFMIFSGNYLKKFPEGLYPEVFMYTEEEILLFRAQKNNFKIVYDPQIQILHYEGKSMDSVYKKYFKKQSVKINLMIENNDKLKKLLQEIDNE